jgi:hypothetical protein
MQVDDGRRERNAAIMVSFDCKDMAAVTALRRE